MLLRQPDAAQIRGALGLLRWENLDLAKACGVTAQSISNIKNGATRPQPRILSAIQRVLEFQGIEFLDNSGVRLKPENVEIFVGSDEFIRFYDFVYEYLSKNGGLVCVSGVDERLFVKYEKDYANIHMERMSNLVKERNDISMRILVQEGDYNFVASSYAQYKWQAKEHFTPVSFYVFGNCLALISFEHETAPYVVLHKSGPFAEAYRHAFDIAWNSAKKPASRSQI